MLILLKRMVFPVAYTVLPSKSTEVFIEMLDNIKTIIKPIDSDISVKPFSPTVALSDFELGFIYSNSWLLLSPQTSYSQMGN
jgi:hypothetical protein